MGANVISVITFWLRLTGHGLNPFQSNVEALLHLPEPSSLAQLSFFLGSSAIFYTSFSSVITQLLYVLLKQDTPWSWTLSCSQNLLFSHQYLNSLTLSPIFVICDASNIASEAILSQLHQGQNPWWRLVVSQIHTTTSKSILLKREKHCS